MNLYSIEIATILWRKNQERKKHSSLLESSKNVKLFFFLYNHSPLPTSPHRIGDSIDIYIYNI
jgi:hypothetical protein